MKGAFVGKANPVESIFGLSWTQHWWTCQKCQLSLCERAAKAASSEGSRWTFLAERTLASYRDFAGFGSEC